MLRRPRGDRAEFYLYLFGMGKQSAVYVFPRGSIKATTSLSLGNERLAFHRNNWSLLSRPAGEARAIEWNPKVHATQKEIPPVVRKTILAAEKHGLLVERPQLPNRNQLYISRRRCQIVRAKPVIGTSINATRNRAYIPLSLPRSDWAEFLIFYSRPDLNSTGGEFYVVPRERLTKRTLVSPTSSWLREYADAWDLIMEDETASLGETR